MHAVALARRLEVPTVVIPPMPGVMSAFGLLVARRAFELSRAVRVPITGAAIPDLEGQFAEMEREARTRSGIAGQPAIERYVEIRHLGQESAVEVESKGVWKDAATAERSLSAFGDEYERLYGRRGDGGPLEISMLRVLVAAASSVDGKDCIQPPDRKLQRGRRKVCFEGSTAEVTVIPRQSLAVGEEVAGPAVIEERESTTVLWPGDRAVVHASSALVISVGTTS